MIPEFASGYYLLLKVATGSRSVKTIFPEEEVSEFSEES